MGYKLYVLFIYVRKYGYLQYWTVAHKQVTITDTRETTYIQVYISWIEIINIIFMS